MTPEELRTAVARITEQVMSLSRRGVVHYYAGGAVGFDMAAAITVLNLKQQIPALTLTLALPCRDHTAGWGRTERELFRRVLARADGTVYVNEHYFRGCMQVRNRYMVDRSSVCLAFLTASRGGTYHTVSYAKKQGVPVIRLDGTAGGTQVQFFDPPNG